MTFPEEDLQVVIRITIARISRAMMPKADPPPIPILAIKLRSPAGRNKMGEQCINNTQISIRTSEGQYISQMPTYMI